MARPALVNGDIPAGHPFQFNSFAHVLRLAEQRAETLGDLLEGLRSCPDGAIFQHTFRTLQEHHYIREGFSNDFAHWAMAACNEPALAEQLASADVREFTTIEALRQRVVEITAEYLMAHPYATERPAMEPFYFAVSDSVEIPTRFVARSLGEFVGALAQVSIACVHYHFIDARARLGLNNNDFSLWIEHEVGLPALAARINRIDMYTATLEDVRRAILAAIAREVPELGEQA